MTILDHLAHNFRAVFTGREPARPDPRDDLRIIPVNDATRPDAATVHRVRWELERIARKREREAQMQRLRDATPTPEFSTPRKGQEVA